MPHVPPPFGLPDLNAALLHGLTVYNPFRLMASCGPADSLPYSLTVRLAHTPFRITASRPLTPHCFTV